MSSPTCLPRSCGAYCLLPSVSSLHELGCLRREAIPLLTQIVAHMRRHEPHFCLLRESGRLEAVLEAADGEEEGEDAPFWSPVGAGWAVRLCWLVH